ncbi:MAG: hypothetical protein K6B14_03570 [Lachnospiraceae bacterium]|nr:hypothetical protein [Lachnospiraceae bacterium]
MYKYEMVGDEEIEMLTNRKRNGEKVVTLTAREVEDVLNVSGQFGAKHGTRYPLCCQAMDYASRRYKAKYVSGSCPGSTYKLEYKLTLF